MAERKPTFKAPGKQGDILFSALVRLAALVVLLLLGGIIVSLIISSWPSIHKFGFAFLWNKTWDAPNQQFGALAAVALVPREYPEHGNVLQPRNAAVVAR